MYSEVMFRAGLGEGRGRVRAGFLVLLLPCALECTPSDPEDPFPESPGAAGRPIESKGGEGGAEGGAASEHAMGGGQAGRAESGNGEGGVGSADGGDEPAGAGGTGEREGEGKGEPGGAAGAGGEAGPPPLCRIELHCDEAIGDDEKIPCAAEIFSDDASVYRGFAGVEVRGRTSKQYPKKNYSIELRTQSGAEDARNLFAMGKESDWVLDGSWVDRSFMRNSLVFELFRDAGHYAPESHFCALKLNDTEQGIYRLCERIKRDDDRVAIAADDGTGKSFVAKQDEVGTFRLHIGAHSPEWRLVYPNDASATSAQVAGVQSFFDELGAAIAQAETSPTLFSLLDLDTTVDWILVQELSKNIDGYNLSLHLVRDAGGAAKFLPWDFDLAFGQPTVSDASNEAPGGWIHNRTGLIRALASRAELRERLGVRWRELREGPFSEARVSQKIDRYLAALEPSWVARNFEIWPIEEVDFSPIYPPYTLYSVGSHSEEVRKLREWVVERLRFMDQNIDDFPTE